VVFNGVLERVTGVTGDICVNLHAGNDHLTMNLAYVNGAIDIQMETGEDTVILGNADVVSTRTELRVDLGSGNDLLDGKRLYIGTNQIIGGGDGNDAFIFDGFLSPQFTLGASAAGHATWLGGNGHDRFHVIYAFIVGTWTVDLGDGSDGFDVFGSAVSGAVQVFGRGGHDLLRVDTNFFDADLLVEGNSESDSLFLANGLGTEVGTLRGGDGSDAITVQNQTAVRLDIDAGAGIDAVDIRSSAFDHLFALLGDDNDLLTVGGNLSRLQTSLDGGLGDFDTLLDLGNSFFGSFAEQGFEVPG
jgi:hypothetical protein